MAGLSRRERERQTRQGEIIAAAERVFRLKGFGEASMDEIAREAQFTKRTVYQYFVNKEDLYFAVVVSGLLRLRSYLDEAVREGGSGLENVRQMCEAYFRFSKDHPDVFRLVNPAQHVRVGMEGSVNYQEMGRLGDAIHQQLTEIISSGQADGSIRDDLPARELAFSTFLIVTGFFYRLHQVGEAYAGLYGLNQDNLASMATGLVEDALRSHNRK